ncbi:RNAase [bacterium (Candidatus Blackallbacteria) CG17_big_fil_post_rev_8_21_14_2_50_48_46]|uniref:RNAase n=1 Tax=bacterium (Candidatus Blackallbacteria) CG17_big_fil_post_rev_8_21_14_2_50_48_46 TaxID=2014261 RepID=A0A2M7FZM5_9BACT|nr:MAG: RNAase [bacterium (Candidatus Blackallbacteria) CG18_big_fil_WC_8_21_14_2_50_49_26]PIW14865.1 MAG: RNAase [bacterium (Candidatus Blackallbacteria) CG17_big_fil_post_rev_8_21_14_2_50_48_46]PIW44432.1 MAG: RNAase [bacterium (Candidatus Blackallbacteria) CG13_big_fil_rev_8_21_14_2_50_49_14]
MGWESISQFLVKEHVGLFKAANNFDIFELSTGDKVLECREDNLGLLTKIFRFTDYKRMTPFDIEIREPGGKKVVTIKRGISIFLSKVQVFNEKDQVIGGFQQKFFSIGGKFDVLDKSGNPLCTLQGKWTGWDFKFMNENTEFAHVTKKWAGLGKELFTSADNYVLEISDKAQNNADLKRLILAAVMCIDMVLKE